MLIFDDVMNNKFTGKLFHWVFKPYCISNKGELICAIVTELLKLYRNDNLVLLDGANCPCKIVLAIYNQ